MNCILVLSGRGVFATQEIWAGDFVVEYTGELINGADGEQRKRAMQTGFRFFFNHKGSNFW